MCGKNHRYKEDPVRDRILVENRPGGNISSRTGRDKSICALFSTNILCLKAQGNYELRLSIVISEA